MQLAPIVIFTYNRPYHTQQTIEALLKNEYASESDLIIYSDAPKNETTQGKVEATRQYLKKISGFKSIKIVEREKNYGLATNIIEGVTEHFKIHDRIIVLEDDLITSPYFLRYMNEALELYINENKVISIHGYIYHVHKGLPETFFLKGADCLGWATWKRGWDLFNTNGRELLTEIENRHLEKEFDFGGTYPYTKMLRKQVLGKVGSWAIRWYASAFLKNKLTLYPGTSLVFHNGSDGSGTNTLNNSFFDTKLSKKPIVTEKIIIEENINAKKNIEDFFRKNYPQNTLEKIVCRLRNIIC